MCRAVVFSDSTLDLLGRNAATGFLQDPPTRSTGHNRSAAILASRWRWSEAEGVEVPGRQDLEVSRLWESRADHVARGGQEAKQVHHFGVVLRDALLDEGQHPIAEVHADGS